VTTAPALPPIMPHQCRDGRKLLGWNGVDLALRAKVEPAALIRFEHELVALDRDTLGRIREALETGGVEFERGIPRVKDRQGPPIV
jgi:hypothetical protein